MISFAKGSSITYKYDGNGLRTSKIVNGVQYDYFYVDGQLMYEKKGSEYELFYRYHPNGRLDLVVKRRISDNYKWYFYPASNSQAISLKSMTATEESRRSIQRRLGVSFSPSRM